MTVASPISASADPRTARAQKLVEPFQTEYPFDHHFTEVSGGSMHYIDEGPKNANGPHADETVLCVHGNPTWSFYYRRLVQALSTDQRVIATDHIGCGLSDKPQDWSYRLADHIANLERLVLELDLQKIHLVVHDWGGAIGSGVAVKHPERFLSVSASNTAAFPSERIPARIDVCRLPVFGPLAIRGFNAFAWAATRMAVEKRERMTAAVRAGYLAPYGNWQDRIATLRFVQDIPLSPKHPSHATLCEIDAGLKKLAHLPVNLFWGERDWCFTPDFRRDWQARFPDAQVLAIEDAGHYLLEDAHEQVIPWLTKQLNQPKRA